MQTIEELAISLDAGRATARELVEQGLARIEDEAGEGRRAFMAVYAGQARAMAEATDTLRRAGRAPGRYAGIPVSLKDLFDVAGEVTRAGSRALADAAPASAHATVVRRVLEAGLIPMGRTNMTEFAFSGLGINPHYGTPLSPWDRAGARIPGGSSSGAGVSVADGMVAGALGTDTGGSCRIPAALCGVVGFKPTARRVPLDGVLPLAPSLDSVGPLARSVACCAVLDSILAGGSAPAAPQPATLSGLRLACPENVVRDGMDATVAAAFERALARLSAAGARIVPGRFPVFEAVASANATGGLAAVEAYAWHRELLATKGPLYDPRIRVRIMRGEAMGAADYVTLRAARRALIAAADAATEEFDAVLLPTCPLVPPRLAELADERDYNRINLLLLRNTAYGNFLDRCAISLPCHALGEPPVGLMLIGETMGDARLLAVAAAVERVVSP